MSSHNVKVDWGSGGGKSSHSRRVGNAKAAGPQEFGRLKGPMTGPAYGIRSSAIAAYHAKTPQQQLAWRNGVIVRARALGILKGRDVASEVADLRAQAAELREQAALGGDGSVRDEEWEAKEAEREAKELEARGESGLPLEACLAFSALAARMPTAQLTVFCLAHRGSRFAVHCYVEASQPKWNVVRFLTREENDRQVTFREAIARGEALPGLMGKVAAELAAAAATARPVSSAAAAAAPKAKLPKRESYKALSLESKLWWQRRVFSQQRPKWTAAWWDLQGDHSLPEQARSHCYHMRAEAEDNLDHAKRYFPADVAAHAQLAEVAQRACDLEVLASRCPTVVAILQWGRGSLTHPAAAARKKAQQKKRRLNGKERAAAEKAAAAAIRALPDYITATAASAYTQPMEAIRSLNFKNLPLATTLAEQAQLREALGALVTSAGASVAKTRGALFVPTQGRGGPTKGFGFVECSAAAGAQRVLMEAGARGTLALEFNGITSQVFVELAASNRQTKEQMEARKAKDEAERRAAQAKVRQLMVATLRPSTKVELAEEDKAAPAPEPVLAKVCLGATVKARREAEEAAAAAALKAEVQAMFSAPLGGILHAKPKAPKFKQSFVASAKKGATAAKLEVVDEFTVKEDGVVKRVAAAASSELGAAQAAILRHMAADAAKAKKAARDKAYAQWQKDKAEADADPLGWGIEDWVEPE